MGRAYELRKGRREKRFSKLTKAFSRLGKEIAMAVKLGGPDPALNAKLRVFIQNAKGVNMPKDRIEAAIKRASNKDEKGFEEIVYEGYAPYGVAILIECATDNSTRTVANVRMHLTRAEGTLGKTGSLDFIFERVGVFKLPAEGVNIEELELELIDYGLEEIFESEGEINIYTKFSDYGAMQKILEEKGLNITSSELQRIPNTTVELNEAQAEEVLELVERIEEDDDVQSVYHNLK